MILFSNKKISPKWKWNAQDLKEVGINMLKFTAPILAVFFNLLAQGVPVEKAYPVALVALWGVLANLFNKLSDGK